MAAIPKSSHKTLNKHKTLVTWGPAASIIVVFAIYVIAQIVGLVLVNLYPLAKHWNSQQTSNWINNSVVGQFWFVVFVEALSLLLLHYFLQRRKTNFRALGLNRRPKFSDAYYMIAGFVVYFVVFYVTLTAVTKAIPQFNPDQKQNLGFSSTTSGPALWLVFISLVVLPPIVEEILFRGFLYTGLRGADWHKVKVFKFLGKYPKIVAAIITSLIFASLHLLEGNGGLLWVAGLDTFILSLVLVYLREKTDSLYASMGVHMIKNLLAFVSLFVIHSS
jgi:membrane protease YdiL (CAAX protease family)